MRSRFSAAALRTIALLCCCTAVLCGCDGPDVISMLAEAPGRVADWFYSTSDTIPDSVSQLLQPVREQIDKGAGFQPIEGKGEPAREEDLAQIPAPPETKYNFPALFYPYRAMLSEAEQSVYDLAYASAVACNETFALAQPVKTNRIGVVVQAFFYDHPELFWMETSYGYTYDSEGNVRTVTLRYNGTIENLAAAKASFEAKARAALSGAAALENDVQREKQIHDYLLETVDYDLNSALNQSAYSALVNKSSVCAGYARAFQYLMMQLEIPCYYCVGDSGGDHAWNIICLGGEYYHVDVAWDDPIGNTGGSYFYEYFNLTDAEIAADHTRTGLSLQLPACEGTAMSYNAVFGDGGGQPVRKGANLFDYEQLGFTASDILRSLDDYNSESAAQLIEAGEGTHTFYLLLADEALQKEIYRAVEDREWEAFVSYAAQQLGLSRYSAGIQLSAEPLADGYYRLTQTVTLTGQETAAAPGQREKEFPQENRRGLLR